MFFLVECAKRSGTWYRAGVDDNLCVRSIWALVDVDLGDVSLRGVYLPSIDEWY